MRPRWLIAGWAGCLVLLGVIVFAWLASYEKLVVATSRGKVYFVRVYMPENRKPFVSEETPVARVIETSRADPATRSWERFGIDYIEATWFLGLGISFGYVAAPVALAFACCTHLLRRQRRRAALGLCLACGYDLRESTGRCPECGQEVRTPTKTA